MDEPLSNLDAKLRVQMRSEVARIQHELKATTVYVTHDQVEAMTMGDRVAIMRRGVLQQVDTPMRLYHAPVNLFVASFIGSPAMNLFEAQLERRNGHLVAQIGDQFLRLEPEALTAPAELDRYVGRTIGLGVRPEHFEDAAIASDAPGERRLKGVIRATEALGSELIAHVEISGRPVNTEEVKEVAADLDDTALAALEAEGRDATLPVVARFDESSRARSGHTVEIAVETERVHFFDLDSGVAVGGHPVGTGV
jgi:multiple sugar transport system ATP-binding protein